MLRTTDLTKTRATSEGCPLPEVERFYSKTSSARVRRDGGISRPSDFPVLRYSKQEFGGLLDGKLGRFGIAAQPDLRIKCLRPSRVTIVTTFSRQRHCIATRLLLLPLRTAWSFEMGQICPPDSRIAAGLVERITTNISTATEMHPAFSPRPANHKGLRSVEE